MDKQDVKIIASLYVYGDDLDLDAVSNCVGSSPTTSRRKGDKRISSTGREIIQKTGVWETTTTSKSQALSDHILELASKMSASGDALKEIAGVQEAHLDLLVSALFDSNGMARCDLELTEASIDALKKIGLPVHLSVTFSPN